VRAPAIAAVLIASAATATEAPPALGDLGKVGTVDFPTSCSAQAQPEFVRGVERIGGFGGKSDVLARCAVFLGKATRLVEYHLGDRKRYRATVCFGASSTTDDLEGALTPADCN